MLAVATYELFRHADSLHAWKQKAAGFHTGGGGEKLSFPP